MTTTKFRNGDELIQSRNLKEWRHACERGIPTYMFATYADGSLIEENVLYNIFAIKDKRGLATVGWHIPSDIEWQDIQNNFDEIKELNCQGMSIEEDDEFEFSGENGWWTSGGNKITTVDMEYLKSEIYQRNNIYPKNIGEFTGLMVVTIKN